MAEAVARSPDASPAHSIWLGNGTTALYLGLRAFDCKSGLVAVQPNVCANVIAAILASGNRPLFIDIERTRLGIDPAALRRAVRDAVAVVAVHSYGTPCDTRAIREVCSAAGRPLIEDCAQAEGAQLGGETVGAFGDVAIFSYGAGKIIEAGGGGRIVARDPGVRTRLIAEAERLPKADATAVSSELSAAYKRAYNRHYPTVPSSEKKAFTATLGRAGAALLSAPSDVRARVQPHLSRIESVIAERQRKALLYQSLLPRVSHVKPFPFIEGSVPWRFNVAVDPGLRDPLFRKLLADKVPSSTWYPNIARFLDGASYETTPVPNADWLDAAILNLWLDEGTDDAKIGATVDSLDRLLH